MQYKYLISTNFVPVNEESLTVMVGELIEAAAKIGLKLVGMKGQYAPSKSCYNFTFAFDKSADPVSLEMFMTAMARALFPSHWCECNDPDFTVFTFNW